MAYDYYSIVHQWYEELKTPFFNYIRSCFNISADDVLDLYTDTWLDLRKIILDGRATDNKWKALIFKIGWRKADRIATRRRDIISISNGGDEEGTFNPGMFEAEKAAQMAESESVYEDPYLQMVLGSELSYIPEPCNKILKLFYYEELSMAQIAKVMNYSNSRSAITTKNRCFDKLKARVKNTARQLGIID